MNYLLALQEQTPQTTQELRDQIRTSVQDQIRAAQGQPGSAAQGDAPFVVTTRNGKVISISNSNAPAAPGTVNVPAGEFVRNLDVPPRAAGVAIAFFVTMAVIIIGLPITRALARFVDRRSQQPQIPAQVTAQLTQLTQAVDAIAIEVERISEGQRFTTKLLSEQQKAAKELPSS